MKISAEDQADRQALKSGTWLAVVYRMTDAHASVYMSHSQTVVTVHFVFLSVEPLRVKSNFEAGSTSLKVFQWRSSSQWKKKDKARVADLPLRHFEHEEGDTTVSVRHGRRLAGMSVGGGRVDQAGLQRLLSIFPFGGSKQIYPVYPPPTWDIPYLSSSRPLL
ncbi:hypothetical protein BaRGS_00019965 [Batillaria attramentaria]|uniref:Uncharacterized protein n=1 Tax=Batillaria attramentaria TaxID=370345 RepID=A0ABD0KPU7_9CAEN